MRYFVRFAGIQLAAAAAVLLPCDCLASKSGGFERNQGQTRREVEFLSRIQGATVFFSGSNVTFRTPSGAEALLRLPGSIGTEWRPEDLQSGSVSYFIGNDPSKWIHRAPVYGRIVRRLYPGIEVAFYPHEDTLEYDILVAPGADPGQIRIQWSSNASMDAAGSIAAGPARQLPPRLYQRDSGGTRHEVAGRFVPAGQRGEYKLELTGPVDSGRTLVVDPVIAAASYLGGEADDEIVAIGPGFVAGHTGSIAFPDASLVRRRTRDIFVRGTGAVDSGYFAGRFEGTVIFGGSDDDEATGATLITLGRQATIRVAGSTRSRDLPSFAPENRYRGGESDGFIAYLTVRVNPPDPAPILFSSCQYLGGSGADRITGLASTPLHTIATGITDSPDLNAPNSAYSGGRDAFYVIPGIQPEFGYLGGPGDDAALAVSADNVSEFTIGGQTASPDFAGVGAGGADGFLVWLQVAASVIPSVRAISFTGAARIGGAGTDRIDAVACGSSSPRDLLGPPLPLHGRTCLFAGTTDSSDLPVRGMLPGQLRGGTDAFAGSISLTTGQPEWLRYWGGSGNESVRAIVRNWAGDLMMTGDTASADLPLNDEIQSRPGGGTDAFLAIFDAAGQVRQSTYFGGAGDDKANAIAIGPRNNARIGGSTTSSDLPETRPGEKGSGMDGFLAEITSEALLGPSHIAIPKDGVAFVGFRASGGDGVLVTYRSTDPTRIRFSTGNRSTGDVVTLPAESRLGVEAAGEPGESEVIASAPGYPAKRIRVSVVPGVLRVESLPPRLSIWASRPLNVGVAIAAATVPEGALAPASGLRTGFPLSQIRFVASDPDRLQVETTAGDGFVFGTITPRRAGPVSVSAVCPGYESLAVNMVVEGPRVQLPSSALVTGQNAIAAWTVLPQLALQQVTPRGVLTIRSQDPSRVLLSLSADSIPGETVSFPAAPMPRQVLLHGGASLGSVNLTISSGPDGGGEDEQVIPVEVEPVGLAMGFDSGLGPLVPGRTRDLDIFLTTASRQGSRLALPVGSRPLRARITSANPSLLRIPASVIDFSGSIRLTMSAVAPGESVVTLTAEAGLPVLNPEMRVTVSEPPGGAPVPGTLTVTQLPTEIVVGKDLQAAVSFFMFFQGAPPPVRIRSSNPALVMVSASSRGPAGAESGVLDGGNQRWFWVHGLRSTGEASLTFQAGDLPERRIRVILAPSTIGLVQRRNSDSQDVLAFAPLALDEESLESIARQQLRPGVQARVQLRVEGAPAAVLSSRTLDFDSETFEAVVRVSVPDTESYLIVEAPEPFASAARALRVRLDRRLAAGGGLLESNIIQIPKDLVQTVDLLPPPHGRPPGMTSRSLSPAILLLSNEPDQPGQTAIPGGTRVHLHGKASGGIATVRVEAPGRDPFDLSFALTPTPLRLTTSTGGAPLAPGQPFEILAAFVVPSRLTPVLQPGLPPMKFQATSSNPSVARLASSEFEIRPGQSSASLRATAGEPGAAEILVQGPPEFAPYRIAVTVAGQQAPGLAVVPPAEPILVGRNLQTTVRLALNRTAPPGGVLVRVTSADPSRLLVSRTPETPGAASATIGFQAGFPSLDFQAQALADAGEVRVTASVDGGLETSFNVQLRPSWLSVRSGLSNLVAATAGRTLQFSIRPVFDAGGWVQEGVTRPGIEGQRAPLSVSSPGVLSGVPETIELAFSPEPRLQATAVAPGEVDISVGSSSVFGSPPPNEGMLRVRVPNHREPAVRSECQVLFLAQHTQRICEVRGPDLTFRPDDPSKVLLSLDPSAPGAEVQRGSSVRLVVQALAGAGTVDVVVSSPGYEEFRIPVVLTPARLTVPSAVPVRRNGSAQVAVSLARELSTDGFRAGAEIPVTAELTPAGIAAVEPTRFTLRRDQDSGLLTVRGVAAGSAALRIRASGLPDPPPVAIEVVP